MIFFLHFRNLQRTAMNGAFTNQSAMNKKKQVLSAPQRAFVSQLNADII